MGKILILQQDARYSEHRELNRHHPDLKMNTMPRILLVTVAVALLHSQPSLALDPPAIPLGAWYKSGRTDADYVKLVAQALKDRHLNTVVGNDAFTQGMIDIFAEQGIAVITRGGKFLDHPAVIGSVLGEEPAPGKWPGKDVEQLKLQYEKLREETEKPLLTCVVGDGLGVDNVNDPWIFWKGVEPQVRSLRWYGIARGHYGILHKRLYKGHVAYSSVLRIASSGKGPYWIVLPSFGKNQREADHQNPTAAQMKGMVHLALAYGARGILFWALQNHGDWQCLVAEESLKPTDEKAAALADVAAKLNAHAALIKSLRPAGGDIRCPNSYVEAIGQVAPDRTPYLYTVNKNTKEAVSTVLLWWGERPRLKKVRDLFTGENLEIADELDEEGYLRISLSLAPGEGKLLSLGDRPKRPPKAEPTIPVAEGEGGAEPTPARRPIRYEPAVREEGPTRARKLLGAWLGQGAKWEDALFGGRLLVDGKPAFHGGGKLIGAYENESGAFAAWDASAALAASPAVKTAFITSGTMAQPRPLAIVLFDLVPKDGEEHTYELHLPMASSLEAVRTLKCNLSQQALEAASRDANVGNKIMMRNFRYFECYPRGRANFCADTILRPATEGAPGWLTARMIEPWDGPIFPAAYQKPEGAGNTSHTLVVSGKGKELRLKLLLFVDDAPADNEPRIFTVWTAKNELRFGSDGYLRFRRLPEGRTTFTFSGPEFGLVVGANDDKTTEDEMQNLDEE